MKPILVYLLFVLSIASCSDHPNEQPEMTLQLGHTGSITSVVFSPDGITLASGSSDNSIKLWDIETGAIKRTLADCDGAIEAIAFSDNGELIACGSKDYKARLWDVKTGELKSIFSGHHDPVTAVSFSPDGKTLGIGFKDTVVLLNVQTSESKKKIKINGGDYSKISAISFYDDGKMLIVSSGNGLKSLDAESGIEKLDMPDYGNPFTVLSNDRTLISRDSKQTIALFDLKDGKESEKRDLKINGSLYDVSDNGKVLIGIANDTIKLFSSKTGEKEQSFTDTLFSSVKAITISGNGKWVAVGNEDNTVQLWDTKSGKKKWELKGQRNGEVKTLDVISGGDTILITGKNGKVMSWNFLTGVIKEIKSPGPRSNILPGVEKVVFSGDGKMAASSFDGKLVGVWQTESGDLVQELIDPTIGLRVFYQGETESKPIPYTHVSGVSHFVFSPDSKTIVTSGSLFDPTLKFWDTQTGKVRANISFGDKPTITASYDGKIQISFKGDFIYVRGIAFSPIDNLVASTWADDKIRIANSKTGKLNSTINMTDCDALTFSSDGTILICGSSDSYNKPGEIKLWNVSNGEAIRTLSGHTNGINSIAISPDCKTIASASKDRTVRIWDMQTGKLLQTLKGHNKTVQSAAFFANGKFLISADEDGMLKLWNPDTGQLIITIWFLPSDKQKENHSEWLAFTPDGHYSGTADAEKSSLWKVGKKFYPCEKYKQAFYQKDLLKNILLAGK